MSVGRKIFLFHVFVFIFFQVQLLSYPWPIKSFQGPHPVIATLGEFRLPYGSSSYHLHQGIDIKCINGTPVFSIVTGAVEEEGTESIRVGNYRYVHIVPRVNRGDTVEAFVDTIGIIRDFGEPGPSGDHLHFEEGIGVANKVNPLRINGFSNYSDGADPVVWGENDFVFYKQASSEKLSSPLWGKVDILVRAKDIQDPPGSENVSVYRIGYNIAHNISASQVLTRQGYGYHENIRFDHASGEVNCIYDKTQSDNSTYYYWVTNALGLTDCNRYWNTKLKAGEEWNGTEAKINTEAMYPDEEYEIAVVAYDIKGNKAENSKVISLDNYVPFADRVTVYKDTDIKYDGKWDLSGNEMHLNIPTDDSLSIGDEIKLTISFSEKMNSQIEVNLEKDRDELSVDGDWFGASNALWVGNVTIPDEEEAEGEWTIMISSKDLADHTLDIDPSSIGKRDNNGQWRNYNSNNAWDKNHKIHVGEPPPPRVVYSVPSDNAQEVPVYKDTLTIIFSKTMEQNVTQDAVSIVSDDGEDISFNPSWKDTITLQIFPSDTLDYCMEYICTISDEAMSEDSVILDGNTDSDGKPGGAHIFTFTTEPPDVILYLSPFIAHVEEGNPLNATLYTIADSLKKEVECNIDFNAYSPGGWLVSELSEPSFLLFPDSIHKDKFTIRNGGTTFPLLLSPKIPFKCDEISCLGFYWSAQGHMHDHPDENQSPGKMEYSTPWLVRSQPSPAQTQKLRGESTSTEGLPDIGILLSGWADGYGHILGRYGIETLPVKPDLEIINNPEVDISDAVKLLVIGSAGLKGFNSPTFEQDLENYVVNGGNLLVFTQKYGSDLSVLPGNLDGYGWNEDQSCFWNAAYLNQWHPVLSGQTKQVMACNVDGYISEYPDNAEILLGRTKNAMPALLYYNYGAGTVIVSSLYSDWGYGHNQRSGEELNLIRDLTTWALNPVMEIPEFYPDSSVSVPVCIKYIANDTTLATAAIVKVYNPNRNVYDSVFVPVSLNSGEETQWVWTSSSIPENLGLWTIDYALMDVRGEWIQTYNRGAVFAQKVDINMGDYNFGDFQLWVNSDKEEVLRGDTVNFDIFLKNNRKTSFTGKVIVVLSHRTIPIDSFLNVTIPPDSIININYSKPISSTYNWRFGLYKSNQYDYKMNLINALANNNKGISVIKKPFVMSVSGDKFEHVLGIDTVHYKVNIKNEIPDSCFSFLNVYTILDSVRHYIWSDTIGLAGKEIKEIEGKFFPMDYDTTLGKQQLCCDLFYRGSIRNSASLDFELIYPTVKCSLALPDSFIYRDTNLYTITLISSANYLPPGKLLLSEKNYSDSLVIDYNYNFDTTLVFNYQPDIWEISRNLLKAQYEYGGQYVETKKYLGFNFPSISAFRPQYQRYQGGFLPRDTAVFMSQLALKGSLYGIPLEFCLWSDYLGSDTLKDTIILNPCSHRTIKLKAYTDISVPADTPISYNYRVNYLNKEYTNSRELTYFITPPEAVLEWPVNDTFSIGNTIPIRFNNTIKTFSRIDIQSISICGNGIEESLPAPGEVTVPAEGYYIFPITVPDFKKGQYRLKITAEMVEGKGVNLDSYQEGCPIYIDGLTADMEVLSSKDYYGYGEDIPFSSLLENRQYSWSGSESLKVARVSDSLGKFSIWDLADRVDTFGLIDNVSGGLVLDSVYSLREYLQISYIGDEDIIAVAVDEFDKLWLLSYSYEEVFLRKKDKPDGDILAEYIVPQSLYDLLSINLVVYQGILYLPSSDGKLCKLNPATWDIIGYIQPPDRGFLNLSGIAIKENGNILALEDTEPGVLWELSNSGDSIDAYVLPDIPLYHQYNDITYNDGTIYIATSKDILRIRESVVDTFYHSSGYGYWACLDVTDNGRLMGFCAYAEGSNIVLFTPEGEIEAWTWIDYADNVFCYKNDILALKRNWALAIFREFGKDYGMLKVPEFLNTPSRYQLHSSKIVDEVNAGSISYKFLGPYGSFLDEDNLLPLSSMYGTDSLPPLYITMEGNFQNSPVFYACSLSLKVLDAIDSLIVENEYPLNLSPHQNVSFADTIKDTIPPANYCVLGNAYSSHPQEITKDSKYFKVIGNNLTLLLNSDKEEGFPGDTFRVNPITINPLPLEEENLRLLIRGYYSESETTYVDTTFDLSAESADSFPFTIAPEEPVVVKAELTSSSADTILREFYPLIKNNKLLSISLNTPELFDFQPFGAISKVYNHSLDDFSVEVKRMFLSDTLIDAVAIESGNLYTFIDTFVTEKPGTLKISASAGGEVFTKERFIDFGIKGNIQLDSLYAVSPDLVAMSGVVSNGGLYPLECKALFCMVEDDGASNRTDDKNEITSIPGGMQFSTLTQRTASSLLLSATTPAARNLKNLTADLSAKRMALSSVNRVGKDISLSQFIRQLTRAGVDTSFSAIYLTPGKKDTVPIVFNRHDIGNYELLAFLFTDSLDFMFDSTSSKVNVIGDNQMSIDSIIVSENCDSNGNVPLTAIIENQSYSTFAGNIAISSINCYIDSSIEVAGSSKDTLVFLIENLFDEGIYTFTASVSEGGIPIDERLQKLEFHPVYRFDSLPISLEVTTPDSGIIRFPVSNIGNATGERSVRVDLADVININENVVAAPASLDTFFCNFLVPEDFPGGEYFADAYILKNAYPEVDTFFNVKVNGLVIKAADSLDKFVYNVNDTADLSILIRNQSLWSGYLLASLQYGELEVDTSFILGGMEKGVLNETLPRDTLYLDTSGIYMFDPINSESYDSLRVSWSASLSDSLIFQMRTDSLIGRGDWITLERGSTYLIDDWMQINFANKSPGVQWIDAICLYFNSLGCTKLDTFPLQREIVTFEVPVDTSESKLGWGIYYPSGRSVVLDERYVYLSDSLLTTFTDKGRYEIFDTVHATLCKNFPDTNYSFVYRIYFSPTEEIWDTFVLAEDTINFSFIIPEWTRSGTYSIDYLVVDTAASGSQLIAAFSSQKATKNTEKKDMLFQQNPKSQILNPNLTIQPFNSLTAKPEGVVPLAKQWVLGKPELSASGDSVFISGEYLFDVNGITVYFKNAKMDTNFYHQEDTARIRTEISSDIDLSSVLTVSSTGSAIKDTNLDLRKDTPNKFEFEYPLENCRRGMNELYLHLAKDSVSLAGFVIHFDVYVSDTTAPVISILEEPSNTYSSNRSYQLKARIYGPDENGTPIHDTLYYRIASVGGSSWQALLPHSMRGDTHKYLIPSHPNGTHIEYILIATDEFGNRTTYPEEGNSDFWVLSPLKPTWDELTYLADTSAVLTWNPPEEMVYYHCGLCSDTIDIKENTIATRFTTQCLPAVLKTIGLEIAKESGVLSDTLTVSVYTVAGDSLPGTITDSFEFTGTFEGYTEFDLQDIQIPENGIFVGIKGSSGLNSLLDGFGEGTHTAIDSNGTWNLATSGELLIDGIVSHLPAPRTRGSSEILTFDVFRSTEQSDWTKIASGLTSSTYTDESTQENQEYSYKIMASFGNPVDSFLSAGREVFIDVSPPQMDTIAVNEVSENELVIWATLADISGIAWDSLGYKNEETINMISEDSCKNNKYFFSLTFLGDTFEYFLKTRDASLIGNYARYPANGFYQWGSAAGIGESIPDSTYLFRMANVLVSSNIEIKYALSEESDIQIMFFDILGRKAKILVDETQKAGYYSIPIRSSELPKGIYFLRMKAGDYRKTLKLVKVR